MKQPVVIPPQNTPQNTMGQTRIFQIDDNEEVYVAADLEMIYMSEVQDHNNIHNHRYRFGLQPDWSAPSSTPQTQRGGGRFQNVDISNKEDISIWSSYSHTKLQQSSGSNYLGPQPTPS